jgi:uncharacterized membrane protein
MVLIPKNQVLTVLVIVVLLLAIPLVAMQFTSEVQWDLMDFLIAAVLLLTFGLFIAFALNQPFFKKYRWVIISGAVLVFVLLWAELAVGVFGSPIAGS